jgi:beta-phosphoglucomutase
MTPELRAVMFDYDGTIANTDLIHMECWNALLARSQASIDEEFYSRRCAGASTDTIAARLAERHPEAGISPPAIAAEKDALFDAWMDERAAPLMPGVPEMLSLLARHQIPAAIVTGAPRSSLVRTLEQHGIAQHFRAVVTREDVAQGKPSPEGYQRGLRLLQLPAEHALALEDTGGGVRAAKAAGLLTLAIPHRFTRGHDFTPADLICRDMHHAASWVAARLLGGRG